MGNTEDAMEAVRQGRVEQRREWTSDRAADCYRYLWLLDGQHASQRVALALSTLYANSEIVPGTFPVGAGVVPVVAR